MIRRRRSPPARDRRDFRKNVSADGFDAEEDNPNPQNTQPPLVVIDPARFPILATHWPSMPPNWRSVGEVAAGIVDHLASRGTLDDEEPEDAAA